MSIRRFYATVLAALDRRSRCGSSDLRLSHSASNITYCDGSIINYSCRPRSDSFFSDIKPRYCAVTPPLDASNIIQISSALSNRAVTFLSQNRIITSYNKCVSIAHLNGKCVENVRSVAEAGGWIPERRRRMKAIGWNQKYTDICGLLFPTDGM